MNAKDVEKISAILKSGSPVITAADVKHGVMEQVQLYFEADGEAVMDVITKTIWFRTSRMKVFLC